MFSVGVLGLVGAFVLSSSTSGETQYRAEAAGLAQDALQIVWNKVRRDLDGTVSSADLATAGKFAFGSAAGDCGASASAPPSDPDLAAWQARAKALLPGEQSGRQHQHLAIDASAGRHNQVTVTLCWQTPQQPQDLHRLQAVGYVN